VEWLVSLILVVFLGVLYFFYRQERAAHRKTKIDLFRLKRDLNQLQQQFHHLRAYHIAQTNLDTDAVIQLDVGRHVLEANQVARSIFGEPAPETTLISWTKSHQLVEIISQTMENRVAITHQFEHQGYIFQVRATTVGDDGQVLGAILTLTDVSELQRLGRARRDFVANISHDLGTPIAGVRLVSETLLSGALNDPDMARHLTQKILAQTDTLQQINQELMDLTMIESGRLPLKMISANLANLVRQQIEHLRPQAERKNLDLVVIIPETLRVLADESLISRVLTNLIHNAIKFTVRGGVTIGVLENCEEDMVCIVVADTGMGISQPEQGRIFERFYKSDAARSRESGTGLGLAIAKHIVEAHGGKIWVESTLGEGSKFFLSLPSPVN
jgi:two-component system phosphate regulon sensor histidine kinase PhoR